MTVTPVSCRLRSLLLIVLLAGGAACGGSSLRVTDIQLGRSVNPDGTVAGHTPTFAPADSIYLSVFTAGVGSGTISVRWLYGTRLLDEPRRNVSYTDVAATDFKLQSVSGFPPGEYTAEVLLDGQPAGSRTFRVTAER
jgi:hypothetical protein